MENLNNDLFSANELNKKSYNEIKGGNTKTKLTRIITIVGDKILTGGYQEDFVKKK